MAKLVADPLPMLRFVLGSAPPEGYAPLSRPIEEEYPGLTFGCLSSPAIRKLFINLLIVCAQEAQGIPGITAEAMNHVMMAEADRVDVNEERRLLLQLIEGEREGLADNMDTDGEGDDVNDGDDAPPEFG